MQESENNIVVEKYDEEDSMICVNELVPVATPYENNMERIADMTEEFSRSIEPLL